MLKRLELADQLPELLALLEVIEGHFAGPGGDADGMVVQRGFPKPPSFHEARLVSAPDEHFVDVITHGHGVMYSYADRVPPADRWAIAAYIRALQRIKSPAR